jgi:hydroxymethylbilane synthase
VSSLDKEIVVAARGSLLSRAQVAEVYNELKRYHPEILFRSIWVKTAGDIDQVTSLTCMEKTDFFTKEVDELIVQGKARIGIHSAKDLPETLCPGLVVIKYTKGVDPSDVFVFRKGDALAKLPLKAKVGTSSLRRIENLHKIREDLVAVDIRGTIETRLQMLDEGRVDALVMAKAALIRLGIERSTENLIGPTAPLQGRLAITAREEDVEMRLLFSSLA